MLFHGRSPKKIEENLDFSLSPKPRGWAHRGFKAAPDSRAGVPAVRNSSWQQEFTRTPLAVGTLPTPALHTHQGRLSLVPGPSSGQENILHPTHVDPTPPKSSLIFPFHAHEPAASSSKARIKCTVYKKPFLKRKKTFFFF